MKKHDKNTKKALVIADTHCGHIKGLCSPDYFGGDRKNVIRQEARWNWFCETLERIGKTDYAYFVGDMVDGTGVKDVSETTLPDLNRQIECAISIVEQVGCEKNLFLYGTRVHTRTADGLEMELEIARSVNGKENPHIYGQVWHDLGGYIIDIRHAPAGKSMLPHTAANPISRERMSNEQWFLKGAQPLAHVILRAHTHKNFCAGEPKIWMGYTLPCLQSVGTKYGRQLSNVISWGISTLTVEDGKFPNYEVFIRPWEPQEVLKW